MGRMKLGLWMCLILIMGLGMASLQPARAGNLGGDAFKGEEEVKFEDEKSQTSLEFDDGLIEGLDSRNMDMGTITSRRGGKMKGHLYKNMMNFDRETKESFRELQYSQ